MLADTINVQPYLIRELDLLQQIMLPLTRIELSPRARIERSLCKRIDTDFHGGVV
jgi:hypothetical protein